MKSVITFIKKHPKTALAILIAVTALIIYHRYFFGGYVFLFEDIGSDTRQQYIAWYNSIAYHLNQGDLSFWDATYGFGTPLYSLNLFHPTLGILYLIGAVFGGGYIAGALIYVHLIHLVLAGIGCYLFLASFRLSKRSVFLFSYIYAFNGFLVMWGQHYHFAIFLFYLPLILAVIERSLTVFRKDPVFSEKEALVQRKRCLILMPLIVGLMLLTGYYLSYMIALICLVYLILRFAYLKIRPVKTLLKAFFGRCLLLLLGVGIGMIYILPSYATVAEGSARLGGSSLTERIISALVLWPKEYFMTFFKKLCSTGLEGIGIYVEEYTGYGNIYEAPNLFFTGLFLILFIQFLIFFPRFAKTARKRIVLILALILALAICFIPAASLVFNGFAYPFARHLFVLIPFMALLCAFMLDYLIRNRCFSVIGALVTILFTAFFCLRAIPSLADQLLKINAGLIFITTFLMAFVLLLYLKRKKLKTGAFLILVFLLTAVQLISNTYTTVHRRYYVSAESDYFSDIYGTNDKELDAWLAEHETGYYRLEKTFFTGSETMDSLLQDYRGISGYNATMNKYVIDFTDRIAPEFRTGTNPYWLTFRELAGRDTLYTLFGIKYIVSDEDASLPPSYQPVAVCGDTTLYEDPDVTFAHFFTETITEDTFEDASRYEDEDKILEDYLILNDETDGTVPSAGSALPDLSSGLYDADVTIEVPESENDGVIDIRLDAPEDGYVFIPVTYENGWSASIDGNETPLLRADYGFMAVKADKGSHMISLRYTAPHLTGSALVTILSLVIYLLFLIVFLKKDRRNNYHI